MSNERATNDHHPLYIVHYTHMHAALTIHAGPLQPQRATHAHSAQDADPRRAEALRWLLRRLCHRLVRLPRQEQWHGRARYLGQKGVEFTHALVEQATRAFHTACHTSQSYYIHTACYHPCHSYTYTLRVAKRHNPVRTAATSPYRCRWSVTPTGASAFPSCSTSSATWVARRPC